MIDSEGSTAGPATRTSRLLVFSDDWGRHPSSCQHLAGHWLRRHEVLWINTIGTRRPSFNLATVRRGVAKARQWSRGSTRREDPAGNPRVENPVMWPWLGSRLDRAINRTLLIRRLGTILGEHDDPPVAITTIPVVADLPGRLQVKRWVYYCVDDFGLWPGLDQRAMRDMESRLVARADVLIAASETLRDKLTEAGRAPHLLTHGVDLRHWTGTEDKTPPPELAGLERPLIVFWGVVDRRMDLRFLSRLAEDMTRGTVLLIGPESDPDPELVRVARVARRPPVAFARLPAFAREAAVLIMPYADLPVTRAMQPLKLKEYLATGKPTVVRGLPATREWADCLDSADSPEEFSRAVRLRLETGLPEPQRLARGRLSEETWAEKARRFESWAFPPNDGLQSVP